MSLIATNFTCSSDRQFGYLYFLNLPYVTSELKLFSNVASFRKEYSGLATGGIEILEQKYEQIASITAESVYFDNDFAKLDSAIEEARAAIQTEHAEGLAGSRTVYRVIGVKLQYFVSCLKAIKEIGILISSTSQTKYRVIIIKPQTPVDTCNAGNKQQTTNCHAQYQQQS